MQKLIRIEPAKCVGCKTCELACYYKTVGEFAPSRSSIFKEVVIEESKITTRPCQQCELSCCAKYCPKNESTKHMTSVIFPVNDVT